MFTPEDSPLSKQRKHVKPYIIERMEVKRSASTNDDGIHSKVNEEAEGEVSKAQILKWMGDGGAPWAIAERLATLYAQDQAMRHPPPLPPRLSPLAITSSPRVPTAKAFPLRRILIVDDLNECNSLMAQYHFELIRMWTANNGGPWLFHSVDSAGLRISTPWRKDGGGKLADDAKLIIGRTTHTGLRNPGDVPSDFVMNNFSKRISEESPLFITDNRPFECDQIADRIRSHCSRGINDHIFEKYEYLLASNKRIEKALHTLSERVCDTWNSSLRRGELKGWEDMPRICVLEGIEDQLDSKGVNKGNDGPPFYRVAEFAETELGWETPIGGPMASKLRTSFVQIPSREQKERIVGNQREELNKIEQWTGCTLHVAKQSKEYGWVVAIVGPRERLWEAEALVKKLRNGEKIE